jgi:hypothetical protein
VVGGGRVVPGLLKKALASNGVFPAGVLLIGHVADQEERIVQHAKFGWATCDGEAARSVRASKRGKEKCTCCAISRSGHGDAQE